MAVSLGKTGGMADQQTQTTDLEVQQDYILISKQDLDILSSEVFQLKQLIPNVLQADFVKARRKADCLQQELKTMQAEKQSLERELMIASKRSEVLLSEIEQERKDNSFLRLQLAELSDVNGEQAEYCSHLGTACCTLLWKTTQKDEVAQVLLTGQPILNFLQLASHTIDSYVAVMADKAESASLDAKSSSIKHVFVLSLCGVITNIAASAFGREFLMTNAEGTEALNSFISILCDIPVKEERCMKLRNLSLMCLYNVGINQKGLRYLISKKQLVEAVSWIIEGDKCADNQLQAIRLLQSMIMEPNSVEVVHAVLERLPLDRLQQLVQVTRGQLQVSLKELVSDLMLYEREQ